MQNYSFETLNDKEFEDLVRDLLQKELKVTLESFKKGRDSGIDLRYTTSSRRNGLIIQVKHWHLSGYRKLHNHLVREEYPKVKRLNPNRYILATSVALTPLNKDKIIEEFDPFIQSPADIYDRELLNNLLGKYPDIEKTHSKLWLSSVNILQHIINYGITGRSEFLQEKIQKNISLFVPSKRYKNAIEILNKNKCLIITGEPGIGKTITGNFIIYNYLARGFELVYIDERIRDAEDVFSPDDKKQIFYFDDFLGSNYLELLQPKNSDSALILFIDRIKHSPNKVLILTSRTTILNQAKKDFQKLDNSKIDLSEHEINIKDYDTYDKARILYNHMYFAGLPKEYLEKYYDEKYYLKIIRHPNFSPRIIDFITDPSNAQTTDPNKYLVFIQEKLDNPDLIWEQAYSNQIDDYCRFLLSTLFSFSRKISEERLREAYEARLEYEIRVNGFRRISNPFYSKVKELLGGFISREMSSDGEAYYDFFNPSIIDFLINYFNKYPDEKWRILESVIYFDQLINKFHTDKEELVRIRENEVERFKGVIKHSESTVRFFQKGSKELEFISLYISLFEKNDVIPDLVRLFNDLRIEDCSPIQNELLCNVLIELHDFEVISRRVEMIWDQIIQFLFESAWDEDGFKRILDLFKSYEMDYDNYIKNEEKKEFVQNCIDSFWEESIQDTINSNIDGITEKDEMESILDSLQFVFWGFNSSFKVEDSSAFDVFSEIDKDEKLEENIQEAMAEDYYADSMGDEMRISHNTIEEKIDQLFDR